jgi:anti-anti-sigma regulatory factor
MTDETAEQEGRLRRARSIITLSAVEGTAHAPERGVTVLEVVCGHRTDPFDPRVPHLAKGVHPQHPGTSRPVTPNFRMVSQGADCWSVSGVVDSEGAEAFGVAVGELAARSPILRLRCEDLELIDAAGMRSLAAAASRPGRRVIVSGAGATVRRAWEFLGLHLACPQVEMDQ